MMRNPVWTQLCFANRGKEYMVELDDQRRVLRVFVVVTPPTAQNPYWRKLWSAQDGKPMGTTAACAARAALRVMAEKAEINY